MNENAPDALFKSEDAFAGNFALGLASLNLIDGGYGPACVGTKIKPYEKESKVSFYYKIDSLQIEAKARIELYQKDNTGAFVQIFSSSYNETNELFNKVDIEITLPTLDSILIVLCAENKLSFSGYVGFARVLFDNFQIDTSASIADNLLDSCFRIAPVPSSGFIWVTENRCQFESFKIFSPLGTLLKEGMLNDEEIFIDGRGFFFLFLQKDGKVRKIIKLINL